MSGVIVFDNFRKSSFSSFDNSNVKVFFDTVLNFSSEDELLKGLHLLLDSISIDFIINVIECHPFECNQNEEKAISMNTIFPKILSYYCNKNGITLIHLSTYAVFDGCKEGYYVENDDKNPKTIYGVTKSEGEDYVVKYDGNFVFRSPWVYSVSYEENFIFQFVKAITVNEEISVNCDEIGNLYNTFDLCKTLFNLVHLISAGHTKKILIIYTIYLLGVLLQSLI